MSVEIFPNKTNLIKKLAQKIADESQKASQENRVFQICLSGGSTPKALFQYLREEHLNLNICWSALGFFWGDERYVLHHSSEHNSGEACRLLFDFIDIPKSQVCEWQTDIPANDSAASYSGLIREKLSTHNEKSQLPQFDLMILGLGDDGHTASLFPNSDPYLNRGQLCYATYHPGTNQTRLTMSLNLINSSLKVLFLVTGEGKADIIPKIVEQKDEQYPASHVNPGLFGGSIEWYLDSSAGKNLNQK